tara:strand:- start:54 stop:305 length:252 start_codon:yes stop_codon:yes gene_type:complete
MINKTERTFIMKFTYFNKDTCPVEISLTMEEIDKIKRALNYLNKLDVSKDDRQNLYYDDYSLTRIIEELDGIKHEINNRLSNS